MIGTNTVIDISHFEGTPDFDTVQAAGITAVFQKATEGLAFVDKTFATNRANINGANLLFGSYHFLSAADGAQQADFFLANATPRAGDLLMVDYEDKSKPPTPLPPVAVLRAFVQRINQQTGVFPGIYSRRALLTQVLGSDPDPILSNCWLWLSLYPNPPGPANGPQVPAQWKNWTLWQYTDGNVGLDPKTVDGIGGCDRETFNGTPDELTAFWQASSVQPAPAPVGPDLTN